MKNIYSFVIILFYSGLSGMYAQEINIQDKLNKKQFREIIEMYETLTPEDSTDYNKMYIIGQAYEGMLKYREAYRFYQHCFNIDTLNADMLNTLGRTAVNLGRTKDAEHYFNRVIAADSTNFYANYQLGRLYFQLGDYEKAADKYHILEEVDFDNVPVLKSLGDCYIRMENYMLGVSYYYSAYDRNKENAGLGSVLINTLLRIGGDYASEALAICDTALYYNPENTSLQRNKAMTLYANKKYIEADSLYTVLLEKGDSTYNTLKYGGSARFYAGQPMKAIDPLEAAYRKDTTSVEVCLLLGSALGKTYDRKQGHVFLNQAEKNMRPDSLLQNRLYAFRADIYKRENKNEEAKRLYYQLWKNNRQLSLLHELFILHHSQYYNQPESEEIKQKELFITTLFVQETLRTNADKNSIVFLRGRLEKKYEEMFFRELKEFAMVAPDGKKSKITQEELKTLIDQIPEKID